MSEAKKGDVTKDDFKQVITEVQSAIMTENMNLKKRLDEAVKLLTDFPGHRNEAAWNNWVYRKNVFLDFPDGCKE